MLNWKAVQSFTELEAYQIAFNKLSDEDKEDIVTEMLLFLAVVKEKESQTDLFHDSPRQVAGLKLTERSTRRKRRRSNFDAAGRFSTN